MASHRSNPDRWPQSWATGATNKGLARVPVRQMEPAWCYIESTRRVASVQGPTKLGTPEPKVGLTQNVYEYSTVRCTTDAIIIVTNCYSPVH